MSTKVKSSSKLAGTKKVEAPVKVTDPSELILRITKPALFRILKRAGVKRAGGSLISEIRECLMVWLRRIVDNMIIFTDYESRKTVSIEDLRGALENNGIYLIAGLNENAKRTASLQSCNSRGKGTRHVAPAPTKTSDSTKKPHRFKPGTVAIREIKRQQKESDCLAIPKLNFNRLVRAVALEFKADLRFSESAGVFDLLQLSAENYLIALCTAANLIAIHARRETVTSTDFQLALHIRESL